MKLHGTEIQITNLRPGSKNKELYDFINFDFINWHWLTYF